MTQPSLDREQLETVRTAAAALMTPRDIARLLSLTAGETEYLLFVIREEADCDIARAYYQGRTETKLGLHESVVKLALKGSPAAQPMADAYLREQEGQQ